MQNSASGNYLSTMKVPERVSFNGLNETSARDRSQHYDPNSHREAELEPKVAYVYRNVTELYNELKASSIDEISRAVGVDPVTLVDKDKKIDLETYVGGLRFLVTRLIKYHASLRDINDKKKDRNNLAFGSEELIPMLEGDLRTALREQEKLKLLLDTSQLKIKHLEKKNDELLNQRKKVISETQNEKVKLKTQLRSQTDQLKLLQEENIVIKRPATGSTTVNKIRDIKNMRDNTFTQKDAAGRGSFDALNTVKSANSLFNDNIKQISTQMDQNKLHNLQTKHELKEFRRKAEQEREKEMSTKQKDLLIARLNIQVEERDRDINRLKSDYDRIFQDLKKMKEKDAEREREEWNKEVLSKDNPNFIEHFSKKIQKKEAKIALLKKQMRKYAISEKKVFIKEKAFELERAEYQDRMIYLQDRVTKLSKITDDFRKSKDDGPTKDRYRKKRDNKMNGSDTSSDDEGRYAGGGILETMGTLGTIPDSYGKTPKVAFEGKLGSNRNQKY